MGTGLDLSALAQTIADRVIRRLDGKDASMRQKAWTFQQERDKQRLGKAAPWKVGWIEPSGKRKMLDCGPGVDGLRTAKRKARELHAKLVAGVYDSKADKTWAEFAAEYDEKILAGRAPATRTQVLFSFANFTRICEPGRVSKITTATIDGFIAKRRTEFKRTGRKEKLTRKRKKAYADPKLISPASVNADLRNIRAAIEVAREWRYTSEVIKFRFVKETEKIPVIIPPAEFKRMYAACHAATLPRENPAEWWRAFLITAYMTGWRVGEIISLERSAVDWQQSEATIFNQKANRYEQLPIHSVVMTHLQTVRGVSNRLFDWPNNRRTLTAQFDRICKVAGVGRYSFHNLRKSFCSVTAKGLPLPVVSRLARHKSIQTTKKHYLNIEDEMAPTVAALQVPAV